MPRRTALPLRILVAALALPLIVSCDAAELAPPGPGIARDLAERRSGTLSDVAYAFDLTLSSDSAAVVTGRSTIDVRWADPRGEPLVVDFLAPLDRVRSIRVNGETPAWEASHDHIVLPAEALRDGEMNRIEVEFEAPGAGLGRVRDAVYTLFVPDRAHLTLPVFDQPDLKGSVSWSIRAPAGWTVVTNGPLVEGPDVAAGGVWRFGATDPISTYLMAFAAGPFRIEEGTRGDRTFRLLHLDGDGERIVRNREAIFDLHAASLSWMEDYTGVGYPFGKFDIVAVPGLRYGGMEHPGAVFYRESALLLDTSPTSAARMARAELIAHETAHIWFGDLVTMPWFDDVWMKEALAEYVAERVVRPLFPEVNHDVRFLLAHHPTAYGADRTSGAHPIRRDLTNLRHAGGLYGPILHQKAPIVLAHLERTIGSEALRDGLRELVRRHAFGAASWRDLIDILDAAHPDDLSRWSRAWVEEAGRPLVEVSWERGEAGRGALVLTQRDPAGQGRTWPQRLAVHAEWEGRREWTEVAFTGRERRVVAWADVPRPDVVIPNAAGVEYGLFRLEPAWARALADALPSLRSALHRAAAVLLLSDAVVDGGVEAEHLLDRSLVALDAERDELVARELVDLVGTLYWHHLPDDRRVAVAPAVEGALQRRVAETRSRSVRGTLFAAWQRRVIEASGRRQLRALDGGTGSSNGPVDPSELTGLAADLALRGIVEPAAVLENRRSSTGPSAPAAGSQRRR